ncbi:MAG: 3'-5' exonuclease [Candidatus Pacearchaeota archaeon]
MSLKPIVMDLEMSGLNVRENGIWQIGAIDLNTMEEFLEEGRLDDEDTVDQGALKVIGKTEEELRDSNKMSQKELLEKFFKWVGEKPVKIFLCQNPQFDISFLEMRRAKYDLDKVYNHRAFDLHTIGQMVHLKTDKAFLIQNRGSKMSLTKILEFCGLKDERIQMKNNEVQSEGTPHNALEDCKLTAECFSRLVYGKNLFEIFAKFEVPEYLKQEEEK